MKIFIYGISSWIGSNLAEVFTNTGKNATHSISGTYNKRIPDIISANLFQCGNGDVATLNKLLTKFSPDVIVNCSRGEDNEAFKTHLGIIEYCNSNKIKYAYFSSSNAVDKKWDSLTDETTSPSSVTDYGIYKGKCEKELIALNCNHLIFRFGAVHGYHKGYITRTERFLAKLLDGQEVEVDVTVYENRPYVKDLARQMYQLILQDKSGVFHLGTSDQNTEYEFLKSLAVSFGYNDEMIINRTQSKEVYYASMLPRRFSELANCPHLPTEASTVTQVRNLKQFSKYVNRN